MKMNKKIKRDTKIIIISVIILTIITIRVSYAAIFSVKSQSTVQEISTGELNVLIDSSSTTMSADDMYPTSDSDLPTSATSVVDGKYANLNLKNDGTLDADFSVTIGYDNLPEGKTADDLVNLQYLNIGIYDVDKNAWVNFGGEGESVYHTSITGLTANSENAYPILRDVITKSSSRQFRVYVWLSESTPTTEIGKLVYLKLDVKSTTVNGHVEG